MAQITITGNVKTNSSGPDANSSSTIQFILSDYMKRASDNSLIAPSVEIANLTDGTGAFSKILESTRDGIPATRFWRVMVRGTFGGQRVNYELGRMQIRATPSSQNLYDLLADDLVMEGVDRLIVEVPIGDIDGSNVNFQTSRTPMPGLFVLFNSAAGGVLSPSAYTIDSGGNIVYALPPQPATDQSPADYHVAVYRAA